MNLAAYGFKAFQKFDKQKIGSRISAVNRLTDLSPVNRLTDLSPLSLKLFQEVDEQVLVVKDMFWLKQHICETLI